MKRLSNRKGLSLIEVIIAMAVFTIIALIMLTVYGSVATVIGGSRQQSVDNYADQAAVEEAIAEGVSTGTVDMQLTFTDGTTDVTVTVNGQVVTHGEITAFIPAYD